MYKITGIYARIDDAFYPLTGVSKLTWGELRARYPFDIVMSLMHTYPNGIPSGNWSSYFRSKDDDTNLDQYVMSPVTPNSMIRVIEKLQRKTSYLNFVDITNKCVVSPRHEEWEKDTMICKDSGKEVDIHFSLLKVANNDIIIKTNHICSRSLLVIDGALVKYTKVGPSQYRVNGVAKWMGMTVRTCIGVITPPCGVLIRPVQHDMFYVDKQTIKVLIDKTDNALLCVIGGSIIKPSDMTITDMPDDKMVVEFDMSTYPYSTDSEFFDDLEFKPVEDLHTMIYEVASPIMHVDEVDPVYVQGGLGLLEHAILINKDGYIACYKVASGCPPHIVTNDEIDHIERIGYSL